MFETCCSQNECVWVSTEHVCFEWWRLNGWTGTSQQGLVSYAKDFILPQWVCGVCYSYFYIGDSTPGCSMLRKDNIICCNNLKILWCPTGWTNMIDVHVKGAMSPRMAILGSLCECWHLPVHWVRQDRITVKHTLLPGWFLFQLFFFLLPVCSSETCRDPFQKLSL